MKEKIGVFAATFLLTTTFLFPQSADSSDEDATFDDTEGSVTDEINTEVPGLGEFLEDSVDLDSIINDHRGDVNTYLEDF